MGRKKREKENRRKLELATVLLMIVLKLLEIALELMD